MTSSSVHVVRGFFACITMGVIDSSIRHLEMNTFFSLDDFARVRVFMDGIVFFYGSILKFLSILNLTYFDAVP